MIAPSGPIVYIIQHWKITNSDVTTLFVLKSNWMQAHSQFKSPNPVNQDFNSYFDIMISLWNQKKRWTFNSSGFRCDGATKAEYFQAWLKQSKTWSSLVRIGKAFIFTDTIWKK